MSLLLANGHSQASLYPIGRLLDEVDIVMKRANSQLAQYALMTNLAISAIPSMGVAPASTRKAKTALNKTVETLMGD